MNQKHYILDRCIERILQGEQLENCLEDYPREAEELRPLLKVAIEILSYASTAELHPDFITRTMEKLRIAYEKKFYRSLLSKKKPYKTAPTQTSASQPERQAE